MKIPDAKAAVDKEWKMFETIPVWDLWEVNSKKEVILEAQRETKKNKHFDSLMDICHLKKCGVGTEDTEVQRQSPAPGGHCKRGLWNHAVFADKSFVCVSDDCCKDHGCYFKITRLRWHLKNAELETKHQKYKGRVVLRGDIVKDDSGSCAVFTEQGSSASQMTAAKDMDIISRLSGCAGQAADAVSAYIK